MKLLAYTVDLSFANAPTVVAQVAVTDPATGTESVQSLRFVDDEGRDIHVMVQNPKGDGMVSSGDIDRSKLDLAIAARLAEAFDAPAEVGARIAAAEKARKDLVEATAATERLSAEIAAKLEQAAALDAEIAAKQAEVTPP